MIAAACVLWDNNTKSSHVSVTWTMISSTSSIKGPDLLYQLNSNQWKQRNKESKLKPKLITDRTNKTDDKQKKRAFKEEAEAKKI